MKKAFTLVELLVVMSMIAVLTASMVSAVSRARTRSRIAKATQETRELTNAILAYEQYAPDHSLSSAETDWTDCDESSLAIVLGGAPAANGKRTPVLFNASIVRGAFRDPWGRAYQMKVMKSDQLQGGGTDEEKNGLNFSTGSMPPNFNALTEEERSSMVPKWRGSK